MFDLVIKNAHLITHKTSETTSIGIKDGRFNQIGDCDETKAKDSINAKGLCVLPGVIDTQVHFREPGATHKEDLESGSLAAVMGGVVAVFEMPNTSPPTTNQKAIEDKISRAHHHMHCDFAFYAGATHENISQLPHLERLSGVCGVKVFMGSSTGNLLVGDDEGVFEILRHVKRRVAFHSEDEARLKERKIFAKEGEPATHPLWRDENTALYATKRLVSLAHKARNKKIHILHVTTKQEIDFLAEHKDIASIEVTPQHLTLSAPSCYEKLGTLAQMNPPIRTQDHQDALWEGVQKGLVDVVGSDHAPHTKEEKGKPYPSSPAGMPGTQTLLPLLLDHYAKGRLSLQDIVRLTSFRAVSLFGLVGKGEVKIGNDADLTFVDLDKTRRIDEDWLKSKSGWSPFLGKTVKGFPVGSLLRGNKIMWDDVLVHPHLGEPLRFCDL